MCAMRQTSCGSTHDNQVLSLALDDGNTKLASKGVLEDYEHCEGEWLSTVFLRPKRDGQYRLILNLSELNQSEQNKHLKVDTLQSVVTLVEPGCYMASVDIISTDACYSVPAAKERRKYLRFFWRDKLYQYICLPGGLVCVPRLGFRDT